MPTLGLAYTWPYWLNWWGYPGLGYRYGYPGCVYPGYPGY